jgi:exportin-T
LTVAGDSSDPPSQRVAWTLLARLTTHFGRTETQADLAAKERAGSGKPVDDANHSIPGYEMFVYDRLIPLVFELPNRPGFNLKDAQTLQVRVLLYSALFFSLITEIKVLGECGTLLAATRKARGQEVVDFFTNVFLPSQNWPPEAISNFVVQLTAQDTKGFKKYWTDFVRSSVSASQSR